MNWWMPFLTAGAALLGSIITGFIMLRAQKIIQKNENTRHARKIAVDLAIAEWQRNRDFVRDLHSSGYNVIYYPIGDYLVTYLPLVEALLNVDLVNAKPEDIRIIIDTAIQRSKEINNPKGRPSGQVSAPQKFS